MWWYLFLLMRPKVKPLGRPTPHYDNQVGQLGTLPFSRSLKSRARTAIWVDETGPREVPYIPGNG